MDEQRTVPFANYPYEREWGDSNRITREYFDSLLLEMRHLDGRKPDTAFTLYGRKLCYAHYDGGLISFGSHT